MQERSLVQNRPKVCFLDHRYASYEVCVERVVEWGEREVKGVVKGWCGDVTT